MDMLVAVLVAVIVAVIVLVDVLVHVHVLVAVIDYRAGSLKILSSGLVPPGFLNAVNTLPK